MHKKNILVVGGAGYTGSHTVELLMLERGNATLVFKDTPAQVCANCGEEYIEAPVTRQLLTSAEEAEKAGVELDVRYYKAA